VSTRINFGNIAGLGIKCAFFGLIGTIFFNILEEKVAEQAMEEEINQGMTETVDETTIIIADSDSLRVVRNNVSHIFNYQYGHVTVRGSVDGYSVDGEFTFDEFKNRDRINEALQKGCATARDFTAKTYNSETHKDVVKKQETAARFAANHCKLPEPGVPK
jgi:hypothetical protein